MQPPSTNHGSNGSGPEVRPGSAWARGLARLYRKIGAVTRRPFTVYRQCEAARDVVRAGVKRALRQIAAAEGQRVTWHSDERCDIGPWHVRLTLGDGIALVTVELPLGTWLARGPGVFRAFEGALKGALPPPLWEQEGHP